MKWSASSTAVFGMLPEVAVVPVMSGREKWYEPTNIPAVVARFMFCTKYGSSYRCESEKSSLSVEGYPPARLSTPVVPPRVARMKLNCRFSTARRLFQVVWEMLPCQAETSIPSTRFPELWADAVAVHASTAIGTENQR